ncbi:MAG: glycoside hydrolase family 3 C-terminal domain-containing protein [Balneolaceae bacterium]|nr:glycoside hydrolase family 3 C-terminal domain-containing protein [Balneolaceae bacterium]MCH8549825.1 glycoside hydrolase family 3 C-terminal domain-containing protein [Balneolaceae bacterium]
MPFLMSATFTPNPASQALYQDQNADTEDRVEDLLDRMTIYEKIGQMTQLNITMINPTDDQADVELNEESARELIHQHHIGSFLNGEAVPPSQWFEFMDGLTRLASEESRLGIPIIYGIDHIHGASYLAESTIFPQKINLAATFNTEHSFNTGWVTAYESADLGHHWNFAPVVDLGVNPLWARFWETYGEDPHLGSRMGEAYVVGYQGNEEIAPFKVAATAKHFLAYSDPHSGWDRTPVQIGSQALHEFHLPPFQGVINAGVKSVMLNSGEINGVPVHASPEIVTGLLREQMGFNGVVITDWDDIGKLVDFHRVAENYKEATYLAVNAGIDVNMTPLSLEFNEAMLELYEEGRISEERIDESVRRILTLKFDLGLFENPYPRNDRLDRIGTEENRLKALKAAEESIILLKNEESVLPLTEPQNILVFGPSAESKRNLSGGWTLAWQGGEEERFPDEVHTIHSALKNHYSDTDIEVIHEIPVDGEESEQQAFFSRLERADMLIYAAGEKPYTEFVGNIVDLTLPSDQLDEIRFISKSSTPATLVMVAGRPRLVTDVIQNVDAFLFAGLPGFEGAEAIANIISGETNPSGKLPFSYPQHTGHFVNYNHKPSDVYFFDTDEANHIAQGAENTSLFQFGEGLSYTTFEYSDLELSSDRLTESETITATVTLKNIGDIAGKESVLWFLTNKVGRYTRPVKELKHFEKVELEPGETATLSFQIDPHKSLAYPDSNGEPILDPGEFNLQVESLDIDFRLVD